MEWKITEKSVSELLAWIWKNRFVAELTCPEKIQYDVDRYKFRLAMEAEA